MTLRSKRARCRILKAQLHGSVRYVTTAGAGAASARVTPDTSCTHPFINRGLCGGNPDGRMRISWPVQLHLKDTEAHIHTSVTLPYSLLPGHRPQLPKRFLNVHTSILLLHFTTAPSTQALSPHRSAHGYLDCGGQCSISSGRGPRSKRA